MSATLLVSLISAPHARESSAILLSVSTSFGQQLRAVREAKGLSAEALAARCIELGRSMSAGQIYGYEHDLYMPSLKTFVVLARGLRVTLDELWGDGEP